jgi:hypothetical protein
MNGSGKLNGGVAPITHFFRGLPMNATGQVVVGAGPIVRVQHGIPFNAAGAVVGLTATTATRHGSGGTPYGPNGELEGNGAAAISHVHQGVSYTAGGIYATNGGGSPSVIVSKDFTMTPGVISGSSAGYRTAPLVGTIAPDAVYAGGTFDLIQAVNDDTFRVETVGDVQFPGISGNLTVQLPAYLGPNRIILRWDINLYTASVPGIYAYLTANIGVPLAMRLSAAPTGTA